MSAVNELVITPEFVTNIIAVDLADETTFTTADKAKLNGIEAGAQVNTVTRVAGKTGVVELDAGDIAYDASETYASGKIGAALKSAEEKLDALDAGDIGYDGSATYDTGTVGKELTELNRQISEVDESIGDIESTIFDLTNIIKFGIDGFSRNSVNCQISNGRIFLDGAATASITIENIFDLSNLLPSTTYSIRLFNATSSRLDNSQAIYIRNGTTNIASILFGAPGRNGLTFTTPGDVSNLNSRIYIGSSSAFSSDHIDVMLIKGNTIPTMFIAPKEVTIATKEELATLQDELNSTENDLSKLDDYTKSALENDILYKESEVIVTGTGNYVEKKITIPINNTTNDVTIKIGIVEGGTASDKAIVYRVDASGNETAGTWVRVTPNNHYIGTITPASDTVAVVLDLYPAQGTPLPSGVATYHNIIVYQGNEDIKVYDDNYFPVPNYYKNHLEEKIETINNYMNLYSADGDAYIFVTDQHWNFNQQNSLALIQQLAKKTNIPMLVSGGDVRDYGSFEYCKKLRSAFPYEIHHVAGNHDYFWMDGINANDKLYNYFDTYANNQVSTNQKRHYYYWEDNRKKIRYIVLSSYAEGDSATNLVTNGFESDQLTWFTSVLNVPAGWECVVFAHYLFDINWENDTIALTTYSRPFADAIDASGSVSYVMQGHSHRDRITHTDGGVPVIVTTCDKNIPYTSNNITDINVDRDSLTINEQAFDVVIVDRNTKTIHAVRIGANALNGIDNNAGSPVGERIISYS